MDSYPFLPGISPEGDSSVGIKEPLEPAVPYRPAENLVEDCPGCGDEKGSNPGVCRVCASYAKRNSQ